MPNSPSSCRDEQETAQSPHSNSVAASPPISPQTRPLFEGTRRNDHDNEDDDPNAMLLVMASAGEGARLVESRSRDDGRTEEQKNDHIMSTTTAAAAAAAISDRTISGGNNRSLFVVASSSSSGQCCDGRGRIVTTKTNESARCASPAASSPTTASLPKVATLTTSTIHHQEEGEHYCCPLSSELVQEDPNKAAVAPMREGPNDQAENSSYTDTDNEDEETSKTTNNMSVDKLVPSKKPRRKRTPQAKPGQTAGRWTQQEHQAFLEGLKECGREWKKVAMMIPTRTSAQIRSHAQKYFSKIQRDHETALLPDSSTISSSSAVGGCATASAVPSGDGQSLAPRIQRNVERILANPSAAQQEVENTMEALRERYRQLQLRLEQRQAHRRLRQGSTSRQEDQRHRVPDDDLSGSRQMAVGTSPRKRSLADVVPGFSSLNAHHDDHSSVSSNISASVASMADDELIALHVLGGALPRGDSSQDLERMVVHASHSSDISVASSAISAHNEQEEKTEHPEEDLNNNSNNHFGTGNDEDKDPIPKRPRSN